MAHIYKKRFHARASRSEAQGLARFEKIFAEDVDQKKHNIYIKAIQQGFMNVEKEMVK